MAIACRIKIKDKIFNSTQELIEYLYSDDGSWVWDDIAKDKPMAYRIANSEYEELEKEVYKKSHDSDGKRFVRPKNRQIVINAYEDGNGNIVPDLTEIDIEENDIGYFPTGLNVSDLLEIEFDDGKGNTVCLKGKKFQIEAYLKSINASIDSEAFKRERLKSNKKADVGIYIHKCLEIAFKNPTQAFVEDDLPNDVILSELDANVKNSIVEEVDLLRQNLIQLHGEDAEFKTEYEIVSKPLSERFKEFIGEKNSNKDCIVGRMDLFVKDKNGTVHMYDFKTAQADFKSMSRFKRNGYAVQLQTYGKILEQWGIKVEEENMKVIPFKTTFNENDELIQLGLYGFDEIKAALSIKQGYRFPDIRKMTEGVENVNRRALLRLNNYFQLQDHTSAKKLDETVTKKIQKIFPNTLLNQIDLSQPNVVFTASENTIRKKLIKLEEGSEDYQNGYRYKWVAPNTISVEELESTLLPNEAEISTSFEGNRAIVFIKDGQLDTVVEKIVNLSNETSAISMRRLGERIRTICLNGSEDDLNDYLTERHPKDIRRRAWLQSQLIEYVTGGWSLVSSDDLLDNGMFLFSKTEYGETVYDLVMITNQHLHKSYSMGTDVRKATSVAGAFLYDDEIDTRNVLSAQFGNMLLMKAMCYITENADFFSSGKIRSVRAINPTFDEQTLAGNRMLQESWKTIMYGAGMIGAQEFNNSTEGTVQQQKNRTRTKFTLKGISPHYFISDQDAFMDIGLNLLKNGQYGNLAFKYDEIVSREISTAEKIEQLVSLFKKEGDLNPATSGDYSPNAVGQAYLYRALLASKNKYLYWENDITSLNSNIIAPAMSKSVNQRIINELLANYQNSFRQSFVTDANSWRTLLQKAYTEMGFNWKVNNASKFFESYFIDDVGKMTLKTRDAFLDGIPHLSEDSAMVQLYDMLTDSENGVFDYTEDGEIILNIPLVRAPGIQRLFKNAIGLAKDWWNNFYEQLKSPVENELDRPENEVIFGSEEQRRFDKLNSHSYAYYSTDLDFVFLHARHRAIRKSLQKQYDPVFASINAVMCFMNDYEGNRFGEDEMKQIKTWTDEYIKAKYENKRLVPNEVQKIMEFLNKLTGLTSFVQLAFSSKALVRESLSSFSLAVTRSGIEQYPGINAKTFKQALKEIFVDDNSLSLDGALHQQNAYFGMANMDVSNLPDAVKLGRWNPFNWSRRLAFITSSLADLYFRNALLRAKMIGDGTDKAYYIKDGIYQYDFSKDERFKVLTNKDVKNPKYIEALMLYNTIVEDINSRPIDFDGKVLPYLEVGGDVNPLPIGYTANEVQSIRNYADLLYGHYNSENQMLFQDKFLGHYLMQYRTFASSRIEQNISPSSATNITHYQINATEEGEQVYFKMSDDGKSYEFVKKSDVTQEEINNGTAVPYWNMAGQVMTGQLTNLYNMMALLRRYKDDPEAFKIWWKNPMHRGLLTLFLMDFFVTAFLMMLVNWIYGEDKINPRSHSMKNEGWWKRWTYSVLMGSFQDGNILNLVSQIDSLDPPVIQTLHDWFSDLGSIITGEESFGHAIVDNFGMTREFSHYFDLD